MSLTQESVVIITGAASGIGRALAVRLSTESIAGLAISDVDQKGLSETAKLIEASDVHVSTHVTNVSRLEQVEKLSADVIAEHGRATHLINNAGVGLIGTFEQISLDDFEWRFRVYSASGTVGLRVFEICSSGFYRKPPARTRRYYGRRFMCSPGRHQNQHCQKR
jgi:NAD(P)-dependent dehydrogenase (short-subunit alcohol dehydrogenase family)